MFEKQFNSSREYSKSEQSQERNDLAEAIRNLRSEDRLYVENAKHRETETLQYAEQKKEELELEIESLQVTIEKFSEDLKLSLVEKIF